MAGNGSDFNGLPGDGLWGKVFCPRGRVRYTRLRPDIFCLLGLLQNERLRGLRFKRMQPFEMHIAGMARSYRPHVAPARKERAMPANKIGMEQQSLPFKTKFFIMTA